MDDYRSGDDSQQPFIIPQEDTNVTNYESSLSTNAPVVRAELRTSPTLCWPTIGSTIIRTMDNDVLNVKSGSGSFGVTQPSPVQYDRGALDDALPYVWTGFPMDVDSGKSYGTVDLPSQTLENQWIHSSIPSQQTAQVCDGGLEHFDPVTSSFDKGFDELDSMLQAPTASYTKTERKTPATAAISDAALAPPFPQNTNRVKIGSMYNTDSPDAFLFQCDAHSCGERTFGRWYDFKRHYDGAHAEQRAEFWCCVLGCERSQGLGGRPFPRKDNLKVHVRKVHRVEM